MFDIATKECRHGTFSYFREDEFVGRSLDRYGEYSEAEVQAIALMLKAGQTVIDVGANIGALTVPMSKMVGPTGRVIAYEAEPTNYDMLLKNLKANHCHNVEAHETAASDSLGFTKMQALDRLEHNNYGRVEIDTRHGHITVRKAMIDELKLEELQLLKIDAEGHELEVIRGARETIERCKPIIYVENDRLEKATALIAQLIDIGYRCFWHRPPLYNPNNWDNNKTNVFGPILSVMMLCIHEDSGIDVRSADEVADLRKIDENVFNREIERYSRYHKRFPEDMNARLMCAHYHNLMQRSDEALALLAENRAQDPTHIPTLSIEGLMMLQRGEWKEGWQRYELRRYQQNKIYFGGARKLNGPQWDGSPTHATVLISAEQGYGDQIMFARWFGEVLERAPNAIFECHPWLYELFITSKIVPDGKLFIRDRSLPEYHEHCPSPSLPAVLHVERDDQIAHEPYLCADPWLTKKWVNYGVPKVGLCWMGSAMSERPFTRDIPNATITKFIKAHGPFMNLSSGESFENWADTAACIAQLDLVITVDTAVAHLAGAMGKPVWLLLSLDPDFRWGLNRMTTPWYWSMSIFRQETITQWQPVLDRVADALRDFRQERDARARGEMVAAE